MITFLDENDVEYGALATIKATNAVNGERSLTGTIVSGDYVLSNIERGWRLRFDDEYFVVTYAKPVDEGRDVQVEFDAVHQFFWDFDKSSVYDQLSDGSHTFRAYLDFIFKNSRYSYTVDSALNVYAFEKQSFGFKKRLTLFNDIITSTGVEFQVNGKVVRILEKVGTDLSTVVRKNFNMNELTIEKNIGDFVTYQKGYGAYFDEEDHSKGRLEVEYTSPLASVYGKLEAEPFVDERYSQSSSLLAVLKENVDNSYTISVSLDMEDLTRAGYKYKQPVAGDYIMAINETLDFQEKIRIVSFTSEYAVDGQLIKHTVTCNDIGSVKKLSASYTHTQHQAANAEANANTAYEYANKALISADGKNTNYYGDTFPVDNPKGTLKKGDLLFLTVGDTVKQYYWNGADWVINPVLDDVEAFKEQIAEELKDVPNREEFENKIAEELATSKAEIETQIETAKTQAESNAKEYADTINQETAKVAELANAAADEIKADLVNVKNNLTSTSLVANNAQAAVDAAKQELTEVANELSTTKQNLTNSVAEVNTKVDGAKAELTQAKQDLTSHAQQLQTQASAQTELTKRVSTVETTANGTKTTVSELSKTVAQNGKDITSVTARTKVVEDDLSGTKTTLSQVKTTADSTSQKTATLETGLNGLTAKFENLSVGTTNHFLDSAFETTIQKIGIFQNGNVYTPSIDTIEKYDGYNTLKIVCNDSTGVDNPKITYPALAKLKTVQQGKLPDVVTISFWGKTDTAGMGLYTRLGYIDYVDSQNVTLTTDWKRYIVHVKTSSAATNEWLFKLSKAGTVWIAKPQFEFSAIASDYHAAEEDTSSKVAEYKQTADQNYASLQTTVQNLDGTVKQNKSEFDQTSSQIKSSISAVDGKIPTNLDSLNLMTGTRDWSTKANKWHMGSNWSTENVEYQGLKVHSTKNGFNGSHQNIFVKNGDVITFSFFAKATNTLSKIKVSSRWDGSSVYQAPLAGVKESDEQITITSEWKRYSKTVHITSDGSLQFRAEYEGSTIPNGNTFYVAGLKLAKSSLDTGYSENPTDTASDITTLNTTLTQTADGLKQLSTKVTSQGNTITSHTNSINSLTTGLSAKVSQSDFNTLSGRVTTAENNITAKANELSSKITSVEGKIPTTVGGRNYLHGTSDKYQTYTSTNYVLGFPSTNRDWAKLLDPLRGKTVTIRAYIKNDTGFPVRIQVWANIGGVNGNTVAPHSEGWSVGTGKMSANWTSANVAFAQSDSSGTGGTIKAKEAKLEIGNIPSDWSPAPEDTIEEISSLSSELKQTKDGITLLATKTELNTAKNDLQSGITTATNKANAAQNTANSAQSTANSAQNKASSNAQTISTHTTQISALNTGLQAKVSQTDFNTLSGRVTTAENNITAKANELSSKITSVEAKIPTTVGGRNYLHGTSDKYQTYTSTNYVLGFPSTNRDWAKLLDPLRGKTVTIRAYIKNDTGFPVRIQVWANIGGVNGNTVAPHSEGWSVGTGKMSSDWTSANVSFVQVGNGANTGGTIKAKEAKLEVGNIPSDWSPAPEDYDSKLATAQSEIKQTTDSIKASVSSLDKSTVKSSSLTINADGIVMKAGKSTTDVANAIGSYFAVNQNAINLFSDKINVKGNMIVSGAITSDKIASKSINTAHLNGKIITADVISSNAVTASAIKAGAVTTDKMSANSINGDRITAGTLDAAKIKAGSITASQIASGTITSNQIKAGGISAANIATGAITTDKIAAGAIDASKIAANAITANMITGGKLNSTNGATSFDLNAGSIAFNNDAGYIQRVAGNKIFAIQTWLARHSDSQDYLASRFSIRNSANNRRSGIQYQLNEGMEDKPTACADMWTDLFNINDSSGLRVFSLNMKNNVKPEWWNHPIATLNGGLIIYDISIVGHSKSLLNVVQELCNKTGIVWD